VLTSQSFVFEYTHRLNDKLYIQNEIQYKKNTFIDY